MPPNYSQQDASLPCKICGAAAFFIGAKTGRYEKRSFHFYRCGNCGYLFIADPWTDYPAIYSEAYYRGKGADPYVDYVFELEHPGQTVRRYEWRGLVAAVDALLPLTPQTRWLDFGCGNGGLVRYARAHARCAIEGHEQGWITDAVKAAGLPLLSDDDLRQNVGAYDVVTAIEVLEHVTDPMEVLRLIRSLLRPGGLFFFTTGNLKPQLHAPLKWPYTLPEVHVSFYEPRTLDRALRQAGFRTEFRGFAPGFTDIIRFKILKTLGVRCVNGWERLLPWSLLSRLADRRAGVTGHPVGWAA